MNDSSLNEAARCQCVFHDDKVGARPPINRCFDGPCVYQITIEGERNVGKQEARGPSQLLFRPIVGQEWTLSAESANISISCLPPVCMLGEAANAIKCKEGFMEPGASLRPVNCGVGPPYLLLEAEVNAAGLLHRLHDQSLPSSWSSASKAS